MIESFPVPSNPQTVEAAKLLHDRDLLRLTFAGKVPPEAISKLLHLLALDRERLRARGGPEGVWRHDGHSTITLEQIDFAQVLEDKEQHSERTHDDLWKSIVHSIVSGQKTMDEAAQLAAAGHCRRSAADRRARHGRHGAEVHAGRRADDYHAGRHGAGRIPPSGQHRVGQSRRKLGRRHAEPGDGGGKPGPVRRHRDAAMRRRPRLGRAGRAGAHGRVRRSEGGAAPRGRPHQGGPGDRSARQSVRHHRP